MQSPQSMAAHMKQDERHHTSDDIFVGIELATRQHQVVVLDAQGCRLTSFKVPHSRAGLRELVERCTSRRVRREGLVHFAFEATGLVWEAVGCLSWRSTHFGITWSIRWRPVGYTEARQMGRDKGKLTDADADRTLLLRTGVVTQCQLLPANYMQLRFWPGGNTDRLRRECARLKTLLVHRALRGLHRNWSASGTLVTAPGCLAVLRAGMPPRRIADLNEARLVIPVVLGAPIADGGCGAYKIEQVWESTGQTPSRLPHGHQAAMREVTRLVERIDFVGDQLAQVGDELQTFLEAFDEATYLATLPGIGWITIAGLIR